MTALDVNGLTVRFHTREGVVYAVENVSYQLQKGQTLGIVGESGSGKSVSCLALLKLLPLPPARIESGTAHLASGEELLSLQGRALRQVRGKRIAMIFQDPMTALNPYLRISSQLTEGLRLHEGMDKARALEAAIEMLQEVGIPDAASRIHRYPHEFSGGMRQRVMIAMALLTSPDILIADEPTTALDVTVQAQIMELIGREQTRLGMGVILITHDLGVVAGSCDEVLVMYAGRVVESGPVDAVLTNPQHPYTAALKASLPSQHARGEPLYTIEGRPPDLKEAITGCPFAPRCRHVVEACRSQPVALQAIDPGRQTACLRVQKGEIQPL